MNANESTGNVRDFMLDLFKISFSFNIVNPVPQL